MCNASAGCCSSSVVVVVRGVVPARDRYTEQRPLQRVQKKGMSVSSEQQLKSQSALLKIQVGALKKDLETLEAKKRQLGERVVSLQRRLALITANLQREKTLKICIGKKKNVPSSSST